MKIVAIVLASVLLSSTLLGCYRTQEAEIEDVSRVQRLIIKNPTSKSMIEANVEITLRGDVDGRAYLYVEEASSQIVPWSNNPGFIMDINKGENNRMFKRQVGGGYPIRLVYVPITAKKGHLRVKVEYR